MTRSTQQVIDDHAAAVESGDLTRIMSDYVDDAVVITMAGAVVGKKAIQGGFEEFLESFPNLRFTANEVVAAGDTSLAHWAAECDTATFPLGVDTFIIQDGRIQRHTVWFEAVPK